MPPPGDDSPPHPPPTPDEAETARIRHEIETAVEAVHLLDGDESHLYIVMLCTEGEVYWRPSFCATCSKPRIVHSALNRTCTRSKISQVLRTKYEILCRSNATMNVAADILAAKARATARQQHAMPHAGGASSNNRYDNRTELSEWSKGESWESYKRALEMYDKASEKKPAMKFNDLINALKKSGRTEITDRLMQDLMDQADADDVITQSIRWLSVRYGKTPTEEFIQAWRAYRTGLRRKEETIAEYINRFEDITRKLEGHGVKLDKREKAIAMVEMAQLSTAECVAVLSIAKFEETGEDDGLEDRMKQAMRSTVGNIMGKETAQNTSTVLCTMQEEQPVMEEPEQVYWDGNRWVGPARRPFPPSPRPFQGGQQPQPGQGPLNRQNDQRGYGYQNQPG